jgi:protocatechuate 3,4-dioxygenase beta subunit
MTESSECRSAAVAPDPCQNHPHVARSKTTSRWCSRPVVLALVAWWQHGTHGTKAGADRNTAHGNHAAASGDPHHGPQALATLSGTVTNNASGAPIANATISIKKLDVTLSMNKVHLTLELALFASVQSPTLVVTTSATGTWTSAVPPGTYIVAAAAPTFVPERTERIVVAAGEQRSGIDLRLGAGGTLVHGTVADVGGGPIAGARVTLEEADDLWIDNNLSPADKPAFVTFTGPDGSYQLTVRDGAYSATARHDDCTPADHRIGIRGQAVTQDFRLIPGAVIRGHVIARDSGKPVAGAWIDATGGRSLGIEERSILLDDSDAVSDENGAFVLRGLDSGSLWHRSDSNDAWSLDAAGPGYASAAPTVVEAGIGEPIDGVTIVVDRAFSISGTVVAKATKKPLAGVLVGGHSQQQIAVAHDLSDKDGHFEIVGVRPGTLTVGAFGEDSVPYIGETVDITDKSITGVVIELDKGVTVSGRVDPPGPASIGLTIEGERRVASMFQMAAVVHADADAAGRFTLRNVPPGGKFVITANTADGSAGKLPINTTDVDQQELVVALETRATISGTVVDEHGSPASDASVDAFQPFDPADPAKPPDQRHSATVAPDGSFAIVGLQAGKVTLTASGNDRGVSDDLAIELSKGEHKTGIRLTFAARESVIRGRVVQSDGRPAPFAWVTVRQTNELHDEWKIGTPVRTNRDGKFTVEHLPKGTYTLLVEGPRGALRAQKTGIHPGETVTLHLVGLGTLAGHVTRGGVPVTAYDLSCEGPSGTIDLQIVAADGGYALEHLLPGNYCSAARSWQRSPGTTARRPGDGTTRAGSTCSARCRSSDTARSLVSSTSRSRPMTSSSSCSGCARGCFASCSRPSH